MNQTPVSSEGQLFCSEVSVTTASCQRMFGSMRSVLSGSPFPHTDSQTPPPVWLDRTPMSLSSPSPSPSLSPLSLPNAHSSPRGVPRGLEGSGDLSWGERNKGYQSQGDLASLLLGNGGLGLEHSLLEAVEGLGGLDLGLDLFASKQESVKFVQDTSKFWYKPDISRDQAITVLKDREPGSFVVRDSHSFRGAYGLAMKVATPPPSVLTQSKKVGGDLSNELVRHFLIECTQKGVRLKGCPNEPYFGSLTALKAASLTLAMDPPPTSTVVHFKVSAQGITLTDNQRKLFFRRHYTVNTVIFCALDPQERKWTRDGCSSAKIFGFVARKSMNGTENVCHVFAEHDPEQPASA
ncbi:unnamed protein product, partial [Coregonus sp. 'balchen']